MMDNCLDNLLLHRTLPAFPFLLIERWEGTSACNNMIS